MTLVVEGMKGLGDNIYQRAFIAPLSRLGRVYLMTPWPELYEDLAGVSFVRQETPLRTQGKNIARQAPERWTPPAELPADLRYVMVRYGSQELGHGSILDAMRRCFGVAPGRFDLPRPDVALPVPDGRKLAVVRPVSVRKEWCNPARNPQPAYIAEAARALIDAGYHVISVADLEEGQEWLEPPVPPAHRAFHHGELNVEQLMALVGRAAAAVGGVGWLLPMAIACGTPLLVIAGGQGGHNAPERLTDPAIMDLSKITWMLPEPYCRCANMQHSCAKDIPDFTRKLDGWLTAL